MYPSRKRPSGVYFLSLHSSQKTPPRLCEGYRPQPQEKNVNQSLSAVRNLLSIKLHRSISFNGGIKRSVMVKAWELESLANKRLA